MKGNFSTHRFHKLFCDCKAQTGPSELAAVLSLLLLKRLKDFLLLVLFYSDPRILHLEAQVNPIFLPLTVETHHHEFDIPLIGEFDRVSYKVEQQLPNSTFVEYHSDRKIF